ncbi:hypothetical protein F5Y18DRAFT_127052 [Xylariaceae sp. FL1019]|nr:hypothetical protein F5Y18DRAFT_127052 [Xylariaceae sp. FL1019]
MDDMAAAKPAPSVDTADMPKKRHQNRNSGNPGNTNTTQSRVVESAAAVDSVASTGHNQLEQSIFGSYTGNNQQPQPRQTTVAQATTAPPYAAQGALSPGFKFPLQRQTVVDPLVVADYGQAKQHVSIGSTQMPQRRQTIIHSPERTQTSSTATQVYLPPHKRDTLVSGPSADYSQNTVNSYPDAGTPSQVALLNNLRRQTIGARQSQGATHHRGASLPQNTVLYGSQITSISQNFDPITEEPTVAPGSPGHHHHAPSGVAGLGGISGSLSDPNIGRYRAVQDTGVGNSRSLVVYDPPATMDVSNAMVLRPDDHGVTTVGPLPLVNPDSEEMAKRSDVLRALTERGRPTVLDIGSDTFLPFVESTSFEFQNSKADVVHINNVSQVLQLLPFSFMC